MSGEALKYWNTLWKTSKARELLLNSRLPFEMHWPSIIHIIDIRYRSTFSHNYYAWAKHLIDQQKNLTSQQRTEFVDIYFEWHEHWMCSHERHDIINSPHHGLIAISKLDMKRSAEFVHTWIAQQKKWYQSKQREHLVYGRTPDQIFEIDKAWDKVFLQKFMSNTLNTLESHLLGIHTASVIPNVLLYYRRA